MTHIFTFIPTELILVNGKEVGYIAHSYGIGIQLVIHNETSGVSRGDGMRYSTMGQAKDAALKLWGDPPGQGVLFEIRDEHKNRAAV